MQPINESRAILFGAIIAVVVLGLFVLSFGVVFLVSSDGPGAAGNAPTAARPVLAVAGRPGPVPSTAVPALPTATAPFGSASASPGSSGTPLAGTSMPLPPFPSVAGRGTELERPSGASTPTGGPPVTVIIPTRGIQETSGTAEPTAMAAPAHLPQPVSATPAASAPQATFVEDHFDSPDSGWPSRERATWSADYHNGRYEISLHGQPNAGVSTVFSADAYRLSADVAINSGAAGLTFGSTEPATFYRLVITSEGRFVLQQQRQGDDSVSNLIDWTRSDALRAGAGAHNLLRIERLGATLAFYANDQLLTRWSIPAEHFNNQYGFAVTAASGIAHASFDDLVGVRLSGS